MKELALLITAGLVWFVWKTRDQDQSRQEPSTIDRERMGGISVGSSVEYPQSGEILGTRVNQ